jgi:hypothetical protein
MPRQRFEDNSQTEHRYASLDAERGAYLPLLAGILVALFLILGLLVDSANLYLKQEQLQKSADLAVEAGLGYRILQGWAFFHGFESTEDPYSKKNDDALKVRTAVVPARRQALVDIVRNTLEANFGAPVPGTVIAYNDETDTVNVNFTYRVPLLILPLVPGYNDRFSNVPISASGQLSPANIVLMLDHSGSMRCPRLIAGPDPCPCRTTDNNCNTAFTNGVRNEAAVGTDPTAAQVLPESRLFSLKRAARRFTSFFNPYRDRIALVPFSTLAARTFSLTVSRDPNAPNFGGVNLTDLNTFYFALDSNFAQGNTNISDALRRAYLEVSALQNPKLIDNSDSLHNQPFFGLLFTDGAPSAGVFRLTKPGPGITSSAIPTANPWLQYTVEWYDGISRWRGPSPFVFDNGTLTYSNFPGGEPPPTAYSITCGRSAPMISDKSHYQDEFTAAGGKCIQNWEFAPYFAAGDLSRKVASNIQPTQNSDFTTTAGQASSFLYSQQYYHAAIEMSDLFRSKGGILFTVGLGQNALSIGNNDPYQNPDDDFSRKEFFLRRLALDASGAGVGGASQDPEFDPRRITINDPGDPRVTSVNTTVDVGYQGYQSYGQLQSTVDPAVQGLYEGTDDPKQIQEIFAQLAKQILLRLTP